MALRIGSTIYGRYTVRSVHRGGVGLVSIVEEAATGARYAVKTVLDDLLADPAVVERFRAAAETWIDLGPHEGLVQALCFDETPAGPLLFLEYVDGIELKALLDLGRPVHPGQALRWAIEIASAMAFVGTREILAGGRGLVHRDLKPGNVLITRERRAKVTDFGLARVPGRPPLTTAEGSFLGTAYYVAPEQIREPAAVDPRADIFSFGVVLYEMLAGRRPFEGETFAALIHRVLNEAPADVEAFCDGHPSDLGALVAGCLAKSPEDRPRSFDEVRERLEGIARGLDGAEPPPAYRTCSGCGLVVPADLEGCLFERRRTGATVVAELDPGADTVDWGPFAGG